MSAATAERPAAAPAETATTPPERQVRLEVNRQGKWCAVALFDASDLAAEERMYTGVEALAGLDKLTCFRIVSMDDVSLVLLRYCADTGWLLGGEA